MKRILLLGVFCVATTLSAFAQGLYLDAGVGLGFGTTRINGVEVTDPFGTDAIDIAVDLGIKAGYGPIAGFPIYVVGELGGIGHRFDDGADYVQFNSYIIGPGVVFYPVSFLQIGGSFGYSFVGNMSSMAVSMYDSESGYACNAYAAIDIGGRRHGCLVGLRFAYLNNTLEVTGAEQETSYASIFVRYVYRRKVGEN